MKKATNKKVTKEFLEKRVKFAASAGYGKARWVHFCEVMIDNGFVCSLYEARRTKSKYIDVSKPGVEGSFKVRFSDHKPIAHLEAAGSCNFFVGRTNQSTTTTVDALSATFMFFKNRGEKSCLRKT